MEWSVASRLGIVDWIHGWVGGVLCVLTLVLVMFVAALTKRSRWSDSHKRGTRIIESPGIWCKLLRSTTCSNEGSVLLAGVPIKALDETKHFKLIGTTGTGKSTAIRDLLWRTLERGDRAVITDPDGGYLLSFYERYRGDVVLNPFEEYAVKWNPFAEVRELYDVDQLASGLIP